MEGKKKSVAGELSLLNLELKRIHSNVSDLQNLLVGLAERCHSRQQLQELSRLNGSMLPRVTGAADFCELMYTKYTELREYGPELVRPAPDCASAAPPLNSSPDLQLDSASFYSAVGELDSPLAPPRSPAAPSRSGRRSDRNVAIRGLISTGEEPVRPRAQSAAPVPSAPQPEPEPEPEAREEAQPLVAKRIQEREVPLATDLAVTLPHKELLEDGGELLFLILCEDEPALQQLSTDLASMAEEERCRLTAPPAVGDELFALWEQEWYRARVTGAPDRSGAVTLYFVDYGNCDAVPVNTCRRLPPSQRRLPAAALPCTLSHVRYCADAARRQLQSLVLDELMRSDAGGAPARAQFRRAPKPGAPRQVVLTVEVEVNGEPVTADVARCMCRVRAVDEASAAQQVATRVPDLSALLDRAGSPSLDSGRLTPDPQNRVQAWLQCAASSGPPAAATAPDLPPAPAELSSLASDDAARGHGSQSSVHVGGAGEPGSPAKFLPDAYMDPPGYRHYKIVWNGRPIYESPEQLCRSEPYHEVSVVNAEHPEHFHLSLRSRQAFERFNDSMAKVYNGLPAHPRLGLQSEQLVTAGSFWVARSDGGEDEPPWYRVTVRRGAAT